MPAPRGPVVIICGIDADGEIQAVEISATDELLTAIRENANVANVRSFFTLDGGGDHTALLTAAVSYFFDGAAFRYVKGTHPGGIPHSGPQGWIGGAWKKNPLQFGYSGDVSELVQNIDAAAGPNTLDGDTVDPGEIWIVNAISALDVSSIPDQVSIYAIVNGVSVCLSDTVPAAANRAQTWSGEIVLSEGDQISAVFLGCTLHDFLTLRYHAVRVDIDQ